MRHQGEYYDDASLLYCDLVTIIMLPCQVTRDNRVAGTSQQNRQITCDQARNADKALYCGAGGELRSYWKDKLFGINSIYSFIQCYKAD